RKPPHRTMLQETSKRRNLERIRLRRTPEAFLGTWLLGAPTWCSTGRRVGSSRPTPTPSLAQTSVSHDLHGSFPRPACISYRRSSIRGFSYARLERRSVSRTSRTFPAQPGTHRCRALSSASRRGTSPSHGRGRSRQRVRYLERVRRVFRLSTLRGLRIEARPSDSVSHSKPSSRSGCLMSLQTF